MELEPPSRVNLLSLHTVVDAEIQLAESSIDPNAVEDPDTIAYDVRLHALRAAVEQAALYNDDPGPT